MKIYIKLKDASPESILAGMETLYAKVKATKEEYFQLAISSGGRSMGTEVFFNSVCGHGGMALLRRYVTMMTSSGQWYDDETPAGLDAAFALGAHSEKELLRVLTFLDGLGEDFTHEADAMLLRLCKRWANHDGRYVLIAGAMTLGFCNEVEDLLTEAGLTDMVHKPGEIEKLKVQLKVVRKHLKSDCSLADLENEITYCARYTEPSTYETDVDLSGKTVLMVQPFHLSPKAFTKFCRGIKAKPRLDPDIPTDYKICDRKLYEQTPELQSDATVLIWDEIVKG